MLPHVVDVLNEQRPRHGIVRLIDHFPLSLNQPGLTGGARGRQRRVAAKTQNVRLAQISGDQRPRFAQMTIRAAAPRSHPKQDPAGTSASTREENRMF